MKIDRPIRDRRNGAILYSGAGPVTKSFKYADLRRRDLSRALLKNFELDGADLRHADLRDADLSYASLVGADLRGANLNGADLTGAECSGADLRNADLSLARLRQAWFHDARFDGADLRFARNIGKGGKAYEAHFLYRQLIRARLDDDLATSVRRLHPWRSLWYRVRWWIALGCLVLATAGTLWAIWPSNT